MVQNDVASVGASLVVALNIQITIQIFFIYIEDTHKYIRIWVYGVKGQPQGIAPTPTPL